MKLSVLLIEQQSKHCISHNLTGTRKESHVFSLATWKMGGQQAPVSFAHHCVDRRPWCSVLAAATGSGSPRAESVCKAWPWMLLSVFVDVAEESKVVAQQMFIDGHKTMDDPGACHLVCQRL